MADVATIYLRIVKERFQSVKVLGDRTFDQCTEEDLHWSMDKNSNSMATIVQHMSGNMLSRWTDFLTTDGEKQTRNRDEEFERKRETKTSLLERWERGWRVLFQTLEELQPENVEQSVTIRSEEHLVMEAIERQVAHYSYHVGQIVYIGKMIKREQWDSLSIPKGQSINYLEEMQNKHGSERKR
ncbi:DUF1572 family protein [Geomicrobium sp. JCM 19038]|uniref:DUF1572 family protein n=1 Tax=Geomicrobium sp. JCM 19038 TaxID=1460635 RepID=UPI00045F2C38|nr:DUF1572 family protein [Geomicrobium sp. JCM 19038]GAK08803.1 hypothetical protein JCM19038_2599 [Geomicrobium sp. JCM 19038]